MQKILNFNSKNNTEVFFLLTAAAFWLVCIFALHQIDWQIRVTVATMLCAVYLWVLSPFSLSFTSFTVILVLVITKAIPLEAGLGGFATGSVFLILSGLMLAQAINETDLARRAAYFVLAKSGGTPGSCLAGLFIILQMLAFVVPSAAVRLALLIPTVKTIVEKAGEKGENENIRRMFVVGLVFGVTVTGSGILPAALANVITVDLIAELTGVRIYYNEWLLYILPVSLSLMPVLWIILMKTFPPEIKEFPGGVKEYRQKLTQLGPLKIEEKKCLLIIFLTLVLWLTEKYHGLHTAVPAMIAVILLGMPRVGYMKWEKMLDIEWSTILLVGFTLSLGTILNETGTAEYLAGQLFKILSFEGIVFTPVAAVLIIAAFTQIMHKFLGNVTTVLVTLIPLVVEISSRMEVDPVLLGVVTGVSGLYGFLLPVETIAGIIIFGTGLLHPLEMIKPGIFLTIASITALTLAAYFWWPVVGLI